MQKLGPDDAALSVRTARAGVAQMAGHDLLIDVTRWQATIAGDGAIELTADARSLVVREAVGGVAPLLDRDRREIVKTIDNKVLRGAAIEFRSTSIHGSTVRGELTIGDTTRPIEFELATDPFAASVELRQTDFGIKPHSALLGTLKVADTVTVELSAAAPFQR